MTEKEDASSELRRRAEQHLDVLGAPQGDGTGRDDLPKDEAGRLIHDLRVHQIELELQNEELRETQKHLQAMRDGYARLFHQAPVGYLIVEESGVVLQANAAFCSMVDRDMQRVAGKPLTDFLEQGDREVFLGRFKAFFKSPEGKTMELRMLRGENAFPVWIRGRVEEQAPMAPSGRKPGRGLLLIVNDITEQKQAEAALLAAKEAAEAANKAKTDFLLNMSHELRTPLNGLLGMLGLLDCSNWDADQRQMLTMAQSSAQRLTGVLTDILDLTGIESGSFALHHKPFLTGQLAQSIRDVFDPIFLEKGLPLHIETAPDLPRMAVGDEARIRQVLFNLVGNAFKFTQAGEVRLRLDWKQADAPEQFLLQILVTDTGIGMSEDQRSRAVDPFFQADLSLTKRYQGAGLGLTIVQRLVTLMGGSLILRSEADRGTEIRCVVPLEFVAGGQ